MDYPTPMEVAVASVSQQRTWFEGLEPPADPLQLTVMRLIVQQLLVRDQFAEEHVDVMRRFIGGEVNTSATGADPAT